MGSDPTPCPLAVRRFQASLGKDAEKNPVCGQDEGAVSKERSQGLNVKYKYIDTTPCPLGGNQPTPAERRIAMTT